MMATTKKITAPAGRKKAVDDAKEKTTVAPAPRNPHFKNVSRAPNELANILRALPEHFTYSGSMDQQTYDLAEAASKHASNALHTVLDGMETLGRLVFVAATSADAGLVASDFAEAGCLIRHLAVEAQSLIETRDECDYVIAQEDLRRQKRGA